MSVRERIQDHILQSLQDAGVVQGRVYSSRIRAYESKDLPCVGVYFHRETMDPYAIQTRRMLRTLEVTVEAYLKCTDNFENDLEGLSSQIQNAIGSDPYREKNALSTKLTEVEHHLDGAGESNIALLKHTYQVMYID